MTFPKELVERLRHYGIGFREFDVPVHMKDCRDAADLIERLTSPPDGGLVERVARAIHRSNYQGEWDEAEIWRHWDQDEEGRDTAFDQAHAALSAISQLPCDLSSVRQGETEG